MIKYDFHKTKTTDLIEVKKKSFILANSLVEKRNYIYFRRGPLGTPNYQCGFEKFKIRKEYVIWEELFDRCNGGIPIYRITRL
jgi:hypothetical protein